MLGSWSCYDGVTRRWSIQGTRWCLCGSRADVHWASPGPGQGVGPWPSIMLLESYRNWSLSFLNTSSSLLNTSLSFPFAGFFITSYKLLLAIYKFFLLDTEVPSYIRFVLPGYWFFLCRTLITGWTPSNTSGSAPSGVDASTPASLARIDTRGNHDVHNGFRCSTYILQADDERTTQAIWGPDNNY